MKTFNSFTISATPNFTSESNSSEAISKGKLSLIHFESKLYIALLAWFVCFEIALLNLLL